MRVLLVAGLLVLAACGSGDDLETKSSAPEADETPTTEFEPGVLAQGWMAHGRSIAVHENGSFEISYRTYRWCSENPAPCDENANGEIGYGGHVLGIFDGGAGPEWTGTITGSVEPDVWPLGPIAATYEPATDTLAVTAGSDGEEPWIFCGQRAADPRCGA